MDDDTKKDYCCGTATGGLLVGVDGKDIAGSVATNAVICGKTTAIAVQAGYVYNGSQITIDYPASGFTCVKSAKALIASAAILLSAAAMI
jgi:hypothetical protein